MRNVLIAIVAVASLVVVGCSKSPEPQPMADNPPPSGTGAMNPSGDKVVGIVKDGVYATAEGKPICPVDAMVVNDTTDMPSETYKGVKYWFCMKSCQVEFDKNPDKYAFKETAKH